MPEIILTLKNDDGTQTQQSFTLEGDLDCMDGIDGAVENFKNLALPQVEQQLLKKAEQRALVQEKKTLPPQSQRV